MLCPWDPRKYADMDTLISDRKVKAGSGEWYRLELVTRYKWDTTGSVLGPLLFQLYINDMTDDIMSSFKILADDTKA